MLKVRFHEMGGDGYIDHSFTLVLSVGAERKSRDYVGNLLCAAEYRKDVENGYGGSYREWVEKKLRASGIQFSGNERSDLTIPF